MLTGNRGEWSEIYAFLKLLSEKKLYAADSDLNRIESIYYPIIKILRSECDDNLEYICNSTIRIISGNTGNELLAVPISEFAEKAFFMLEQLKKSKGSSFSIPDIESFMNYIKCKTMKARSVDKSDIKIVVHDINTGFNPTLGFSIKSKLGKAPTLLNAARTTNFIYEILDKNLTEAQINEINGIESNSKIRTRINKIQELGCTLNFTDMESQIFLSNLQVIDSSLPLIIAQMLILFYKGAASTLIDLLREIERINPCNFNNEYQHPFYEYKVKNFITDIALGMKPASIWNGKYDATGGYLIVKEDGDVLCYHMYNRNDFQEYLLKNSRFETPSSSRHYFGEIYKENSRLLLKLNLQIRFK